MDAIVWGVALIILIVAVLAAKRGKRRGGTLTGAVAGTMWDWQNEEKQRALEIIVEDKAEARDPEDKDGNLPDLARGERLRPERGASPRDAERERAGVGPREHWKKRAGGPGGPGKSGKV